MKISAARQRREMRPSARNRLRLGLGVSACAAAIALMPVSALALTSAVNHPAL